MLKPFPPQSLVDVLIWVVFLAALFLATISAHVEQY